MATRTDTSEFIQKFILDLELLKLENNDLDESPEFPFSFYVHASLITKLEKRLNERFSRDGWEMYEKILKVGNKQFDMYQVIIARGAIEHLVDICDLITSSQCSFPLEENPTLFIQASHVYVMKKFIGDHQLEPYIIKTEEMLGISTEDVTIKVFTFNRNVNKNLNVIPEFRKILGYVYYGANCFYITRRFPWERAPLLRQSNIDDNICEVFPIILQHLETINYDELNIFDLLSLRLAVYDVRDSLQTSSMKWEIDFFIKRELAKYIKKNIFDLHQYMIDKNCKDDQDLCKYLIYEFQDCFKDILYNYEGYSINRMVKDFIKLKSETNVLNKINTRFNVHYDIDGRGFDQMSSSLFFGLLLCDNVEKIDLDTNHQWIKDVPILDSIVTVGCENEKIINLREGNTLHFADDCLAELKSLGFQQIYFNIYCRLADYRVLDNVAVEEITIYDTKIDTDMLKQLHQCCISSTLKIDICFMENNWEAWELLNNLEALESIAIFEDEGTLETMFEFVAKELHRTNSIEFKFQRNICVNSGVYFEEEINLKQFKFVFDVQMSKLEIRDAESNDLVDLFYHKFEMETDVKPDLDFYQ